MFIKQTYCDLGQEQQHIQSAMFYLKIRLTVLIPIINVLLTAAWKQGTAHNVNTE